MRKKTTAGRVASKAAAMEIPNWGADPLTPVPAPKNWAIPTGSVRDRSELEATSGHRKLFQLLIKVMMR